jgi:hypothetical protein
VCCAVQPHNTLVSSPPSAPKAHAGGDPYTRAEIVRERAACLSSRNTTSEAMDPRFRGDDSGVCGTTVCSIPHSNSAHHGISALSIGNLVSLTLTSA